MLPAHSASTWLDHWVIENDLGSLPSCHGREPSFSNQDASSSALLRGIATHSATLARTVAILKSIHCSGRPVQVMHHDFASSTSTRFCMPT